MLCAQMKRVKAAGLGVTLHIAEVSLFSVLHVARLHNHGTWYIDEVEYFLRDAAAPRVCARSPWTCDFPRRRGESHCEAREDVRRDLLVEQSAVSPIFSG